MRQCSITGETMESGFVIQDGEMYIKNESDLKTHLKEAGYKSMKQAFKDEYYYWTEFN